LAGVAGRAWGGLLRVTVGYGYQPWLALLWLLALVVVGALVMNALPDKYFEEGNTTPPFNSLLYTIDVLLPFIDLGYSNWVAVGAAQVVTVYLAYSVRRYTSGHQKVNGTGFITPGVRLTPGPRRAGPHRGRGAVVVPLAQLHRDTAGKRGVVQFDRRWHESVRDVIPGRHTAAARRRPCCSG
jgi:hypothetical protein